MRQNLLGDHRHGFPLPQDAGGEAKDDDKPDAERHEAEGDSGLRRVFLEGGVSLEDEGVRHGLRDSERRDAFRNRLDRREIRARERERGHKAGEREEDEGRFQKTGVRGLRRGVRWGEIRGDNRERAHNVGRMRENVRRPNSQRVEDCP